MTMLLHMQTTIYRTVAIIKAAMIAAASVADALQYLKEHGFSEVEAKSLLKGK
jgi:hypothetical protein